MPEDVGHAGFSQAGANGRQLLASVFVYFMFRAFVE
jgi:hypothetical protein